jgi:hypothetical protein
VRPQGQFSFHLINVSTALAAGLALAAKPVASAEMAGLVATAMAGVTLLPPVIDGTRPQGAAFEDSLGSLRNVTVDTPSLVAGSPITSGTSLADQLLLAVRACVCSGSSFFGSSSIRARSLLIVAHRGISAGCRVSSW